MGKTIEFSIEAFGNKRLTAALNPDDVKGKSFDQIVKNIVYRDWSGEDKRTAEAIKKEISSSGSYTTSLAKGGSGLVKFQPVRLGEPVTTYVKPETQENEKVRIAVTGDHTVGYF